jgi:hypothetical protein
LLLKNLNSDFVGKSMKRCDVSARKSVVSVKRSAIDMRKSAMRIGATVRMNP